MTFRALAARLGRLLTLRGLIAAPGAISLSGLALAAAAILLDSAAPGLVFRWGLEPEPARAVLSTLAGAAMTALGLVYSITLVVFTLAAGSIAPRLLERFTKDRVSQLAIGALGALFLHALVSLALSPEGPSLAPPLLACLMALLAVMLLLVFVDRVARRITVDEEIDAIASGLDARIASMAGRSGALERRDLVLPAGPEVAVRAPASGYLESVAFEALAAAARARSGFLDFRVAPGDPVLKGDIVARALGPGAEALAAETRDCFAIGRRRTEEGDLRFSVSLLLEIALRALSPGVNDSFTAISVINRLVASLAVAAEHGLDAGVWCDAEGAPRIAIPKAGLDELIRFAFDPIRQAAAGNLLVVAAASEALKRLVPRLAGRAREEAGRQIRLFAEESA